MPYQPTDFSRFQPIDPGYGNLLQNALMGYKASQEPKNMAMEQQKAALANALMQNQMKYAPRMSELALQGAELGMPEKQYQAQQYQLLQRLMGGQQDIQNNQSIPGQSPEVGNMVNTFKQMEQPSQPSPNTVVTNPGQESLYQLDDVWKNNPGMQPLLGKRFPHAGVKQHFNDQTGELSTIKVFPSGRTEIETQQIGSRPEEQEFKKKLSGKDVDFLSEVNDQYSSSAENLQNLHELKSLMDDPNIKNATGPLRARFVNLFGSEKAQETLGKFRSFSDQIVKSSMKSFGSRLTDRDLKYLQNMKPGENDSYGLLQGKIESQIRLNKLLSERAEMIDDLIRNRRMSPIQATKMADEKILPKFKENIMPIKDLVLSKYTREDIEDSAKKRGYSTQRVIDDLVKFEEEKRRKVE
jgi:hypothetical protein